MIVLSVMALSLTLESLIPILIAFIVVCILLYAISIVLGMIALPPPIKQLIWLIVAVVVLLFVLSALGLVH